MKIALIRRGYSASGGAEAYLVRLGSALADRGHEPVLVATDDWPDDRWTCGPRVLAPARLGLAAFARWAAQASAGCDVSFSLERVPGATLFRAGDGVHRSWLRRRASFEPAWRGWARAWNPKHRRLLALERGVFDPARTRRVVANSRMVKAEIVADFGFPEERIDVVYNGYSPPKSPAPAPSETRARFGLPGSGPLALFAGSGWERKGLRFALEAIRSAPALTLAVAGKGKPPASVPPNAIFLGEIRVMPSLLAAADFFVLPTIYDPFSNACLEALAHGLPVVTTTANGFSEILAHGITGSVVAPGDARALAEALRFWSEPGRAAEGRQACLDAAAPLSPEANADGTLRAIGAALDLR